jgi:hypothetical protein
LEAYAEFLPDGHRAAYEAAAPAGRGLERHRRDPTNDNERHRGGLGDRAVSRAALGWRARLLSEARALSGRGYSDIVGVDPARAWVYRCGSLAAMVVVLLATAGTAQAATLSLVNGELRYTSDPGERDSVEIYRVGREYYAQRRAASGEADPNPNIRAGAGCGPTPNGAYCPHFESAETVTSIALELGDGDDAAFVTRSGEAPTQSDPIAVPVVADGGPGADQVDLRGSTNTIVGGDGNDQLGVTGGTIDGGPGDDKLSGGDEATSMSGGPGNDVLGGQSGSDTASGGEGEDFIAVEAPQPQEPGLVAPARPTLAGVRDVVACGSDRDGYVAGPLDQVDPDCEDRLLDLMKTSLRDLTRNMERLGIAGIIRKKVVTARFRAPGVGGGGQLGEPAQARALRDLVFDGLVNAVARPRIVTLKLYVTRRGLKKLRGLRRYRATVRFEYGGEVGAGFDVKRSVLLK